MSYNITHQKCRECNKKAPLVNGLCADDFTRKCRTCFKDVGRDNLLNSECLKCNILKVLQDFACTTGKLAVDDETRNHYYNTLSQVKAVVESDIDIHDDDDDVMYEQMDLKYCRKCEALKHSRMFFKRKNSPFCIQCENK